VVEQCSATAWMEPTSPISPYPPQRNVPRCERWMPSWTLLQRNLRTRRSRPRRRRRKRTHLPLRKCSLGDLFVWNWQLLERFPFKAGAGRINPSGVGSAGQHGNVPVCREKSRLDIKVGITDRRLKIHSLSKQDKTRPAHEQEEPLLDQYLTNKRCFCAFPCAIVRYR
jgi:hypothetical protein